MTLYSGILKLTIFNICRHRFSLAVGPWALHSRGSDRSRGMRKEPFLPEAMALCDAAANDSVLQIQNIAMILCQIIALGLAELMMSQLACNEATAWYWHKGEWPRA